MAKTKTEDGLSYPAEAFAYVPDPDTPSEWKLRLWEDPTKKVTVAQLGRAAAAFSPGGFRGQKVSLPASAVAAAKRRIRTEYRKLKVEAKDMPDSVRFSDAEEDAEFASDLSYDDKKKLLATALGIDSYMVNDVFDDAVVYTTQDAKGTPTGTYRKSYSILDGKVTLGQSERVMGRRVYEPIATMATFALDSEPVFSGDDVILRGKVFEVGDYPDKGFALTEEEADAAVAAFAPVENDLEHEATILSGKLGKLRSVVRQGKELLGEVTIPKWLHEAVGKEPIKASLAWARDAKKIVGNALVLHPRVSDAQLQAAFSAAQSQGGSQMPDITKRNWFEKLKGLFSAKSLPEGFEDFDPEAVTFKGDEPDKTDKPPEKEPEKHPDADKDAAKFAADLEAERKRSAGLEARLLTTEAESFYEKALKACKVFPAEKDALIAQFRQAAQDDSAGVVTFGADGALQEGTRIKGLRALVEARPPHGLTKEELDGIEPENLVVMAGDKAGGNGGDKVKPERKAHLLKLSGVKKEAK
jgi:hypothetical protein